MEEKSNGLELKLKEADEKLQNLRTNIVALLQKVQEVSADHVIAPLLSLLQEIKSLFCSFRTLT